MTLKQTSSRPLPDHILPAQFYPVRATTPERRLMLAVLDDALGIALKPMPVNRQARLLWTQTDAWLFSDDEAWPFAFLNVCHALGIEPTWLRARILAKRCVPRLVRRAA